MSGNNKGLAKKNDPMDESPPVVNGLAGESIKAAIQLFSKKLNEHGVSKQTINRALAEVTTSINEITPSSDYRKQTRDELSEHRKTHRKDFFGRAVLFHIEDLFPEADGNSVGPAHGKQGGGLPREVAAGLVESIKVANDSRALGEYEEFFMKKAERYRRKSRNNEVDVISFANDGGVRSVARNMIKKFEKLFFEKGEQAGKEWLMANIESADGFKKMGRKLTEGEYDTIRNNIFKIK